MVVKRVVFAFAALIALLLLAAYLMQRSFLFPAPVNYLKVPPAGYQFVQTRTSDGLSLNAAFRPALDGKPVLVFFHGNGDSIAGADVATRQLVEAGYGALLVEYRGYGGNPGSPNEDGLYRDGDAAISWLAAKGISARQLVFVGNSIGSGPATEMAVRHSPKALILISGFSSLPAVVKELYPFLPVKLLIHDRFDSAAKLHKVAVPILLLHGAVDQLVSADHARRLHRVNPKADLVVVSDIGHELAYTPVAQNYILGWLSSH
jgi:fermentation-respiration switch protein FrsA (DUF1100 family)